MRARPIVKWAGGKTTLIPALQELFPKRVHSYFEPFVGGGAVFYALAAEKRFARAVLNDWNKELVDVYRVVRDFPDELMGFLREQEERYTEAPKVMYESMRHPDSQQAQLMRGPIERAGRFIYLNKAGFNGLYRVNQSGGFNVPWGKKLKLKTFDEANIRACAAALNGTVSLLNGDFVEAVTDAREGDLVYFDPPYAPLNPTSSFTTYTEGGFTIQDQQRLALLFEELFDRGVAVVLSNSDTPFIRDLYAGWEMHEIQVRRAINSKGDKRGTVGELLVVNRHALNRTPGT